MIFQKCYTKFHEPLGEWNLRQFWNITSGIYAKYHVQIMLLFVYTTTHKRFVIFTCRYFKLSWNTTALSQSNCRIFSCSSITLQILSIADKHSFTAMVSPGFFPRGTHNFLTPSVLPHRVKIPAWLPSLFFWVPWVTQEWMEWQMGPKPFYSSFTLQLPWPCSCKQRFLSCVAVSVLRRVNKPIATDKPSFGRVRYFRSLKNEEEEEEIP